MFDKILQDDISFDLKNKTIKEIALGADDSFELKFITGGREIKHL